MSIIQPRLTENDLEFSAYLQAYARDTFTENSRWNPAPQRRFLAQVATKFVLVSSASFQRENMADDEDAAAAACAIVAILAYSHNRKKRADQQK